MTNYSNASMNAALRERWLRLVQSLGWQGDAVAVWERLLAHYTEPVRAYHNLQHIAACWRAFDEVPTSGVDRKAVELAIWFHDVIYDPQAKDNEAQSAEWFASCAREAELPELLVAEVHRLILITQHKALPQTAEEQLLVDVDLSILGAETEAFAEYERQIRQEYAWVAEADFCKGRAAVLEQFLKRERIYYTEHFFERYEAKARENLRIAVKRWRGEDGGIREGLF
jgi:predicted metal-dependent HD superfamily phosphohydrolase